MPALLEKLFGTPHPILGMVHLAPLPGSPRWGGRLDRVLENAVRDARLLAEGGVHGILIENYGDLPFVAGSVEPSTVATMAVATKACAEASGKPVGVNVLRNDPVAALAIAQAAGGTFIRTNVHTGALVTDQGILQGRADETLRARARLGLGHVAIFADILVKHGSPFVGRDVRQAARDAVERGLADAVLVTGPSTGSRADLREVAAVRDEVKGVPLLVASGVTPRDMPLLAALADGVLVGTTFKRGAHTENAVDPARVKALMEAAGRSWK